MSKTITSRRRFGWLRRMPMTRERRRHPRAQMTRDAATAHEYRDQLIALLDAEERYGGQAAAIQAEPQLAKYAPILQRLRGRLAAEAMGLELRGDGRPFPPEVIADASRAFRAILVRPDDADTLM
jgi:hypothetical protein